MQSVASIDEMVIEYTPDSIFEWIVLPSCHIQFSGRYYFTNNSIVMENEFGSSLQSVETDLPDSLHRTEYYVQNGQLHMTSTMSYPAVFPYTLLPYKKISTHITYTTYSGSVPAPQWPTERCPKEYLDAL
jgi:hypothetical protein